MKKIFAVLLAAAMLLSLCACSQKSNDEANEVIAFKMGIVDNIIDFNVYQEHTLEKYEENNSEVSIPDPSDFFVVYPNLSTAILALEKGEINALSLSKSSSDYLIAHNNKFMVTKLPFEEYINKISMLTTDTNTELYDILNDGIKQLKADGTLDKLIEEDLKAYSTSDPTPEELPKFEGAETYKIAVTGDRPPMDFVTADNKAAGFNVALLSEIANIAQVNFEIVQVDTDARLTALASGAADAVFWVATVESVDFEGVVDTVPEGTFMTEDYFSEEVTYLVLK
ncbi:MAG: transporter substrate-binding domain-containing protein [Christensenellales bacterium]|nr:transporter substrate-binding domain-containing protein [Christensenellales bacterium]